METYDWYQTLIKPTWALPAKVFTVVWIFLYILMTASFGTVFIQAYLGSLPWLVALPFVLNLVCNLIFAPIQFGFRNHLLASVDVFLVLVTLVWAVYVVYPHLSWVAYVQLPYLVWITYATALQWTIFYRNRQNQF